MGAGELKAVMREKGRYPAQRREIMRGSEGEGGREEVFWLWGKGEMWYDGGVRSFGDLGVKGFREGFGFFSGRAWGARICFKNVVDKPEHMY